VASDSTYWVGDGDEDGDGDGGTWFRIIRMLLPRLLVCYVKMLVSPLLFILGIFSRGFFFQCMEWDLLPRCLSSRG